MASPDPAEPTVSIGLPVYNGENFLCEAIDSVIAQSMPDWEMVISDNASSDKTEDICRAYASTDSRIRYIRQTVNLGAGPNYNLVFKESRGRYFKWVAHDDLIDPEYIERCVTILEQRPDAVLCHGLLIDIDESGTVLIAADREDQTNMTAPQRFRKMVSFNHNCAEVFGVIRSEALANSQLIKDYTDSDRTLLAQLCLKGVFVQEPSVRFFRRIHKQKSDRANREFFDRARWFNPANNNKIVLSASSQVLNLTRAIFSSPLPARQKVRCLFGLAQHVKWSRQLYRDELNWALRQLRSR